MGTYVSWWFESKHLRLNFYHYMERSGVMEDVYIVQYYVCVRPKCTVKNISRRKIMNGGPPTRLFRCIIHRA